MLDLHQELRYPSFVIYMHRRTTINSENNDIFTRAAAKIGSKLEQSYCLIQEDFQYFQLTFL